MHTQGLRVALIFTGHLRGTCDRQGSGKGLRTLARQAAMCRSTFERCDIFLHTWDRLEKPSNSSFCAKKSRFAPPRVCAYLAAAPLTPSWPCVANVTQVLDPVAVTVERQDRVAGHPSDFRQFTSSETLRNFRMNGASMSGGAELVRRHAAAMGHVYAAAVRMRADIGSPNIDLRSEFRIQFLTNESWRSVRSHALVASLDMHRGGEQGETSGAEQGTLGSIGNPRLEGRTLMNCRQPRLKRIDFCSWSAPAGPLLDTLAALQLELSGDRHRESRCRAYLQYGLQTEFMCHAGLTESGLEHEGVFSEHVLFCAMRAANVTPSSLVTDTVLRPKGYDVYESGGARCSPSSPDRDASAARGAASDGTQASYPTTASVPAPSEPENSGISRASGAAVGLGCKASTKAGVLACDCDDTSGCLSRPSERTSVGVSVTTQYIPPSLISDRDRASLPRPYAKPTPQTKALLTQLHSMQHPEGSRCDHSGTVRLAAYWNAGFAASFHYLVLQLKRALQHVKAGPVVFGRGAYAANNRCVHILIEAAQSGGARLACTMRTNIRAHSRTCGRAPAPCIDGEL